MDEYSEGNWEIGKRERVEGVLNEAVAWRWKEKEGGVVVRRKKGVRKEETKAKQKI